MDEEVKIGERHIVRGEVIERAANDDPRVRKFRASTPDKDRHRTRILPEGIDTKNFMRNPIFLWAHDGYGGWETPKMEHVLGRVMGVEQDKKAFDIEVKFLDESVNPMAQMALGMLEAKALNAVSIGFIPREIKIEKDADGGDRDVPVIVKSELLEVSLVPIPSNPNALAIARSMVAMDLRDHPNASLDWVRGMLLEIESRWPKKMMSRAHGGSWSDPNAPMVGDRIEVVGEPHDPSHTVGIVRQVVETALGIEFEKNPGEIHRWYIPSEVVITERATEELGRTLEDAAPPAPAADRGVDSKTASAALRQAVSDWTTASKR